MLILFIDFFYLTTKLLFTHIVIKACSSGQFLEVVQIHNAPNQALIFENHI